MSLEQILDKIIADAKAEAATIEAKGTEDAERILAAGAAEAKDMQDRLVAKARQDAEERAARTLTLARLEARNLKLSAKQEAIDEAFAAALAHLRQLPEARYRQIMVQQLLAAVQSGREEIILSQHDRGRLGNTLVAEANAALAGAGKPAALTLSTETRPIVAGFILRSGDVEVNCTFETALRLVHDDLVPEVAERLFGDSSVRS